MAEGLNKVILIGNLGADPELRYTQGGSAVLRLRLATSESYVNKAGERQQRTEWHTVILWGKRAEALNNILSKGRSICIEGRIQIPSVGRQRGQQTATARKSTRTTLCCWAEGAMAVAAVIASHLQAAVPPVHHLPMILVPTISRFDKLRHARLRS